MRRLVALLVLSLAAAGCGGGAGKAPPEVKLTVTDRFGERTLVDLTGPEVRGDDTVMRLLQRNAEVKTRYGGGFVQSIGELSGGAENGRPVDWFFYVNGILSSEGATSVDVRAGERIWWDRRDWGAADKVPAVVGSFPEPFISGMGGERYTTRVECDEGVDAACDAVQKKLADLGIVTGRSRLGTEGGFENLRILVGRWPQVRVDRSLERIEKGPKESGVYARMSPDGRQLAVLDERGREVRRLGAGAGMIAATRWRLDAPTWVVTGTDAAGVQTAAEALDESVLHEKFALAIEDGRAVPLPLTEAAGP